jgi:hypothetical protein
MGDWFSGIDADCELPPGAVRELREVGFVVIPGPLAPDRLAQIARGLRFRRGHPRLSAALVSLRNTCWRCNT